jgi:membrane protease YdiL (CAAX protease family)
VKLTNKAWLPYLAPMAAYFAFLLIQTNENLAWVYPLKTLVVAGVLVFFWRRYDELRSGAGRLSAGQVGLAVAVGLVVIVGWIGLDAFYPKLDRLMWWVNDWGNRLFGDKRLEYKEAAAFDPRLIEPSGMKWAFIAVRVFGAVVVVALMEELFWRGFLIRWLVAEDFKSVPLGVFTLPSFVVTVLLFGLEHNQWLAGLLCGALYNWLFYRTKSVLACVVAHGVSNAALAGWVLSRGDWKFW